MGVAAMLNACKKAAPPAPAPVALQTPLGLEKDHAKWIPVDNPLTAEKIELGKMLYFDPRLSADGKVSCATCHDPKHGFSDPEPVSTGFNGQKGNRNSPTTLNRLYSHSQFWDGRAKSLEEQALGPVQNPVEMANTIPAMVANLNKISGYKPQFAKAFGTEDITAERVAMAIAAFERTLLSGNSPYDRFQAGDAGALPDSARRGMAVFMGKGNCNACHPLPNFTDEEYHNLGVGMDKSSLDLGRYAVTKNDKDKGAFKTPTLRQISETAPYLHDGSAKTLEEVVDLYNRGGVRNPNLDAKFKPLKLTKAEKADLVAFLQSLSGEAPKVEPPALPQ
jgi:cytochrome c peroxidase